MLTHFLISTSPSFRISSSSPDVNAAEWMVESSAYIAMEAWFKIKGKSFVNIENKSSPKLGIIEPDQYLILEPMSIIRSKEILMLTYQKLHTHLQWSCGCDYQALSGVCIITHSWCLSVCAHSRYQLTIACAHEGCAAHLVGVLRTQKMKPNSDETQKSTVFRLSTYCSFNEAKLLFAPWWLSDYWLRKCLIWYAAEPAC